jgi:hypothetical protein
MNGFQSHGATPLRRSKRFRIARMMKATDHLDEIERLVK